MFFALVVASGALIVNIDEQELARLDGPYELLQFIVGNEATRH